MGTYSQQFENETRYSKNQLMFKINEYFKGMSGFVEYLDDIELDQKFALLLLRTMALHKRVTPDILFGIMSMYEPEEIERNLKIAIKGNLVKYQMAQFIVVLELDKQTQQEIDRYQYPIPMVIPPREVVENKSSAYLMDMGSLILKNNHHEDDIGLDVLNLANSIRMTFNYNVILNMKNSWANLDKPKEFETKEKYEKRKKAFAKYEKASLFVIAELANQSEDFYFTHKKDKRGRMYCQGYHLSYQSHAWNKANVCFAEGEVVEI